MHVANARMALATMAALTLAGCAGMGGAGHPRHGQIALESPHPAKATMDRLEAEVKKRNLNVVARIDHAAAAAGIGKTLRPTELLIFGNPQAGTPLMECAQGAGIDLPMKALVTVDAAGKVWLTYNDPAFVVHRQGVGECAAVENVRRALGGIVQAVVAK
jgi:uncharacterized protein (DUF302 family)